MAAAFDMRPTVAGGDALCKLRRPTAGAASGLGDDPVPPRCLGLVQRVIRSLEQPFDRRAPPAARGTPDADREREVVPTDPLLLKVLPHVRPNPVGGEEGVGAIRIGEYNGELIAAVTAGDIDGAQASAHQLAHRPQGEVAGPMAEAVVRRLEAVEI